MSVAAAEDDISGEFLLSAGERGRSQREDTTIPTQWREGGRIPTQWRWRITTHWRRGRTTQ